MNGQTTAKAQDARHHAAPKHRERITAAQLLDAEYERDIDRVEGESQWRERLGRCAEVN